VQQVAAAVTVLEGDALDVDGLGATLSEHLATVPGLLARDRHNYAQDEQLSIRGFGTRASFGIRGVRLVVDGIPATMPDGQGQVSHFPLSTAERIEILRGPFSVLHGNASGGVIEVTTATGEGPPSLGVELAGGESGRRRAAVDVRGGEASIGYAVGLQHFATAGERAHSRARRTSLNGKARIAIGDATSLTLLLNALDAPDAQDPQGLDRGQFADDPRQAAPTALLFDTRKSVAQRQAGAVLEHALGAGGLRALAYAGERRTTQFLSIPVGTQANPLSGGGVIDLRAPYAGADLRWSAQATLAGRPLDWVLGVSHDRQRQDRHGYENFAGDAETPVLGVRGALRLDQDDRVDAFDQYVQATWQPADAWSLMAGVRHSRIRFASSDRYVTAANPDDSGRIEYAATSPVFGANWRIAPRWRLYAAYGQGFETPTFNELGYRADGGSGLNFALQPARTRSAEIGMKFDGAGGARSELAVFHADTRDELTVHTSAGGRTTYQNAGRARRIGVEWSATLPIAERWRVQWALTWLDARFRDGFLACHGAPCPVATEPVAGETRIPGIPRSSAYVSLRWGGSTGWHAMLDAQAVDAVPVNHFDDERAPGYAVFGASAGYGFGRHGEGRVFLAIDNLGDRAYAGSVIVNEGNRRYYEPGPGRQVTAGIAWRWR
jgi:iron complex outermembrane receptor protein